jgi:glycosyltransferase involved in cell wall biosynthesis
MDRVSILIPCRNERGFIEKMLSGIVAQDYPRDLVEVLVLEGMSDDGTRDIVAAFAAAHPNVRMIDNPERIVSTGLNRGIAAASGDIIVRMDAHAEYPPNYVSRLVQVLRQTGADNVGGVFDIRAGSGGLLARALARATASPFGIGNARYRLASGRIEAVDTVPFGCYRRDVFDRIGVFDEELVRNQDDELNARLLKHGGSILLVPDVKIVYYARPTLEKMCRMFYQYALFKPLVMKKLGYPATVRQLCPPAMVVTLALLAAGGLAAPELWGLLAAILAIYGLAALWFSAQQARRDGEWRYLLVMPVVFLCIHLSYGWGFLRGIAEFLLPSRHGAGARPIAITR